MKTSSLLVLLMLGALSQSLSACPLCMGAQDSPTASAVNNAIFIMFGVLGLIFSGMGAVVFRLYRRAKNHGEDGLDEARAFADAANGFKEVQRHA